VTSASWPDHPFEPEDWAITRVGLPTVAGLDESLFALGNGNLGVRGGFEQGHPAHEPGALLNGFYETWPIVYPETAYGYAHVGQTIVYIPDATVLTVAWNGELLDLGDADIVRRLDFRTGVLTTTAAWPELAATWERIVSLRRRGVMAQRVSVTPRAAGRIAVTSHVINRQDREHFVIEAVETDPRRGRSFNRRILERIEASVTEDVVSMVHRTTWSSMSLATAVRVEGDLEAGPWEVADADDVIRRGELDVAPGDTVAVTVAAAYERGDVGAAAVSSLPEPGSFEALLREQVEALAGLWSTADIEIDGDPIGQQALRWAIFQLIQASALVSGLGIPAKGLTGQAYEGHYFWDMDVFALAFLSATNPGAAREVIRYRHSILPEARRRAETLSVPGALYPWRTISGEEASAYFEAGTAQYHIDADVVQGVRTYLSWTGDDELLWECGVEMAIETARMWAGLGFHRDGIFHIHQVTGPDEYTALVDDNAYTNLMARMNLRFAVEVVERMKAEQPERFSDLAADVAFDGKELAAWAAAADAMFVPIDDDLGVTAQDADFMGRQSWDWSTPAEKYPLLLHFHPLVIYRHQVLKQADVVMAHFVLPEESTTEQKRADFDYYDPLTTGDSSLSAAVQAAVAARIGLADDAWRYFARSADLDLADLAGNAGDGVHLACAAGVWLAVTSGFAGVRVVGDEIRTEPRLPAAWERLRISLRFRGEPVTLELP
jgi:alpha,alpha-trehalose phosphorylase